MLDVPNSIGDLEVTECHLADPILEEVAIVIECALCPLLRLYVRVLIVTYSDRHYHTRGQIMTCRVQNLA